MKLKEIRWTKNIKSGYQDGEIGDTKFACLYESVSFVEVFYYAYVYVMVQPSN